MKHQHWAVTVSVDGKSVLTIESNCLSGVENVAEYEYEIETAAHHLLSFIGAAPLPSPERVDGQRERGEIARRLEAYSHAIDPRMPDYNNVMLAMRNAAYVLRSVPLKDDAITQDKRHGS